MIPMGFLKACGEPLYRVLARLAQASMKLEYFPRRRAAETGEDNSTASTSRRLAANSTP